MSGRKHTFVGDLLTHVVLIVFTAAALYPVLWVVRMAFTPSQAFAMGLSPIPETFSLDNFVAVIGKRNLDGTWVFGYQLYNSVVIALATSLVGIALSTTAAYAMSRFRFPGRRLSLSGLLITQMFPGTMMMIPLYILLDKAGLLDHQLGLILVYATTAVPFCTWSLKGYFDTIPRDLEEAAIVDGASRATVFFKIILPLARPAIAVTGLFSFMASWNEFILAAKFMNQETSYTLPVVLQQYVGARSTAWGYFAAGAIVVSIPVMALFFALQRNLVAGLTAGAVKG